MQPAVTMCLTVIKQMQTEKTKNNRVAAGLGGRNIRSVTSITGMEIARRLAIERHTFKVN